MRGAWRRARGVCLRADSVPIHRPASRPVAVFHKPESRNVRESPVIHSRAQKSGELSTALWTTYSAGSAAATASVSTWTPARQSLSDADSAGVWLAPVGLRTNSMADGTWGARMPASWPA